ncbi:MAG: hypothetical protein SFU85_06795 [Candidatus Methylacidiphilales bacterium]|nr:hypothetical protein [Candidatus Methylacidiphilales bacterium]
MPDDLALPAAEDPVESVAEETAVAPQDLRPPQGPVVPEGVADVQGVFNPDPGADDTATGPLEWMTPVLAPPPVYGLEPLPEELVLPRDDVRLGRRKLPKFGNRDSFLEEGLPAHTEVVPSRWNIPYQTRDRYKNRETAETAFQDPLPELWHPYRQSVLKGDVPVLGEDIFLRLAVASFTEFETRRLPVPSGISSANPRSSEFFGEGDIYTVQQNFIFTLDFFQGETEVFKPVAWQLRLQPVYNVNYTEARETNALQPDPRGDAGGSNTNPAFPLGPGTNPNDIADFLDNNLDTEGGNSGNDYTSRLRDKWALQEGFFEVHLADVSDNYDFISSRLGYQTFNSDFRGLLFRDTNLGLRFFGNAENNLWQYNLAYFDLREKDTNSELNTFDDRDQQVFVANVFRQDFIVPGYTVSLNTVANFDKGKEHYDRNGFVARPAPIGTATVHDIHAYYVGFSGEGKIGRVNISHSFYQAFGGEEINNIEGRQTRIDAQQCHLELSYDRDWIRYKAAFFYASGDGNPEDGVGGGFDSVIDNPNLFGGPFSYWVRQGFNLAGTGVNLKQRNSLIPNLRTSKFEGQSNFVNPGVLIWGLGTDIELTPETRLFLNANYIRFADTGVIKQVLFTNDVDSSVGGDLSIGIISRPLLNDNIVITAGFATLIPDEGYNDIYDQARSKVVGFKDYPEDEVQFLYSAFVSLSLTW